MKRRPYPIEHLEVYEDTEENYDRMEEILENMLNKINGQINPGLVEYEKRWVFITVITSLHSSPLKEKWEERAKILDHQYLRNYKFWYLFLYCYYCYDLDGIWNHGFLGLNNTKFSIEQNQGNVEFLKAIFTEWEAEIIVRSQTDQLLRAVVVCAKAMISEDIANKAVGANLRAYKKRQHTLFYKYIYLKGLEVFYQNISYIIPISGKNIIYDYEGFAHTARHFSQILKLNTSNRSYFTQDFTLDNIHKLTADIFQQILIIDPDYEIDFSDVNNRIFFEYNLIIYTLWIQLNQVSNQLRFSSLYPTENPIDLGRVSRFKRVSAGNKIYYFKNE